MYIPHCISIVHLDNLALGAYKYWKKPYKIVSDYLYILLTPSTVPCTATYMFSKNI